MVDSTSEQLNEQQQQAGGKKKIATLTDAYRSAIFSAYRDFSKLSEDEQAKYSKTNGLTGKERLMDQLWWYFDQKHWSKMMEKIDRSTFKIYYSMIKDQGSPLPDLLNNEPLWNRLKPARTEIHTIQNTLEQFKQTCKNFGPNVFSNFATFANFHPDNFEITPDSSIQTVGQMYEVWEKFLGTPKGAALHLVDAKKEKAKILLTPEYDYTEKMMTTSLIRKIKREIRDLPKELRNAFDAQFGLPLTALHPIQGLSSFKAAWSGFLEIHHNHIDENFAQKLNKIVISNDDVKQEMITAWLGRFQGTSWNFSQWDAVFKSTFGKLVSAKYFDKVKESQEFFDTSVDKMHESFENLNPYVNEIFKIYPYDFKSYAYSLDELQKKNPEHFAKNPLYYQEMKRLQDEITRINEQMVTSDTEEQRESYQNQIKYYQQQMNEAEWKAYLTDLESQNHGLAIVMKKLVSNKFDFGWLTEDEQQILVDVLVEHKVKWIIKHKVPNMLGVDQAKFEQFINDMFNLKKDVLAIPTPNGDIPIYFKHKKFVGKQHPTLPAISTLSDLKSLPLDFAIDLNDPKNAKAKQFFEWTDLRDNIYSKFSFDGPKFHEWYKVKLTDKKTGQNYEWYLSNTGSVLNQDKNIWPGWRLYKDPLIFSQQDRIPIRDWKTNEPIKIKYDQRNKYDLQVLERDLHLSGDRLGQLLFGYAVWSTSSKQKIMSKEASKDLADKMEEIKPDKNLTENGSEWNVADTLESDEGFNRFGESVDVLNEKQNNFMIKWKRINGYPFSDEKGGFDVGTTVFVDMWPSDLPPKASGGQQYMQMKITYIDDQNGTFKIRISGGELKLNPPGERENKEFELPIDPQTIINWERAFGLRQMYRVPWAGREKDFAEQLDTMKQSGIKVDAGIAMFEEQVSFDGSKFKFKSNRIDPDAKGDVDYFGLEYVHYSEGKFEVPYQNILYEVKHNRDNTFTVTSSFFEYEKEPKGLSKASVKYKRTMDYNNFILFVAWKRLQPQNKKQVKRKKDAYDHEMKQEEKKNVERKWFSIGNIVEFVKNSKNNLDDMLKKYNQEKVEDLTDFLVTDKKMYKKIGGLFGVIPNKFEEGFKKMQVEFDKERDNRVWNKIKYWQETYQNDPHFDTIYKHEIDPLLRGKKEPMERYQMAGALLAMMNKGGPYNRSANDLMGKGLWIKHILGAFHYKRYLKIKKETELRAQTQYDKHGWINAEGLIDEWVHLEIDYIKDILDGRRHGIKEDLFTKFPEEFKQAKMWSRQYVKELDIAQSKLFSQSNTDEKYNEIWAVTFGYAMYQYNRYMKSGRPHHALPFLKKMAETMKTPRDRSDFTWYVVGTMLAGFPNSILSKPNRKFIQKICRSVGVLPGMMVRHINHQEDMFRLLKMFTKGKFPDNCHYYDKPWLKGSARGSHTYKLEDFNGTNDNIKYSWRFFEDFYQEWRSKEWHWDEVMQFFEMKNHNFLELLDSPDTEEEDKKLLRKMKRFSLEPTQEDVDQDITPNFFGYMNDPMNLNKSVIKPFIKNIQNKQFQWETHEIEAAEEFWTVATSQIPVENLAGNKVRLVYMMEKFFNWFDLVFDPSKKTQFARAIAKAQNVLRKWKVCEEEAKRLHKEGKHKEAEKQEKLAKNAKYDADNIMWYMVCWEIFSYFKGVPGQMKEWILAFYQMFMQNIENIDKGLVEETFGGKEFGIDYTHPYEYVDQDEFEKVQFMGASWIDREEVSSKKALWSKREVFLNPIIWDLKKQLSQYNESRYQEEDLARYWIEKESEIENTSSNTDPNKKDGSSDDEWWSWDDDASSVEEIHRTLNMEEDKIV